MGWGEEEKKNVISFIISLREILPFEPELCTRPFSIRFKINRFCAFTLKPKYIKLF